MRCLSCLKSSKKEPKKSWKCWKGKSKEEAASIKRKRKGSKGEESSKKKGCKGCFICKRSSKDKELSRKKGKCGMCCFGGTKSSSEEPLKQKGKGYKLLKCCVCAKSSEKKGCFSRFKSSEAPLKQKGEGYKLLKCCVCANSSEKKGCFSCFKSSEEPLKQKGKGYKLLKCCVCAKSSEKKGCFCCFKSSEEPLKQKGKGYKLLKCCVCANSSEKKGCFSCFKSSEEPLKQKGEGYKLLKCKGSFSCFKSSEEPLKQKGEGHKLLKCCVCAKSSERNGCFSCFKSRKKKELRKQGEKAIAKSSEGKAPKQRCSKGPGCSCGCLCCSSSAHKNLNKGKGKKALCRKKKVLCWKKKEKKKMTHLESLVKTMSLESDSAKHRSEAKEILRISNGNIAARIFTYREIATATRDFAPECLLGKGGFGKVYKGLLMETKKTVAVKKLDRSGYQGNREFLVEVLMLSLLSHHNLVNLLGYCTDRDERILVYDYMPHGSLEDHLFDLSPDSKPLDWNTRMKIAVGAATGLEHLHDTANPPVIYRDFKASNILLDHDFNPRLADFGLAKLGPVGAKNHVSTRVMGTFGYCAPEYALTGKLTMMSDIYSFGVVLLELITGRKAMDPTRPRNEQRLVDWVRPLFKDKKKFMQMADPLLGGNFPVKPLYQALAIASMCVQESDTTRPIIKDVVTALHFLTMPNNNRPSEEVPENSVLENELPTGQ